MRPKRVLLTASLVVLLFVFSLWLNRAQSYCTTKIEPLAGGGQSTIYQCGDEILKFYRRPWEMDLVENRHKLEALNELGFVPKTTQFYRAGFRQELIRGAPGIGLSDGEHYELGMRLARVHQLRIGDYTLTESTPCQSNTRHIYTHLTMGTVYWVRHCAFTDANGPSGVAHFKRVLGLLGLSLNDLRQLERNVKHYDASSFCHNDLHYRNMVKSDQGIKIIDFDHANYGYRGYDIAYWLTHAGRKSIESFVNHRNKAMAEFMRGYISVNGSTTSINELHREICHFLPYTIIDHLLGKKPKNFLDFAKAFNASFHSNC